MAHLSLVLCIGGDYEVTTGSPISQSYLPWTIRLISYTGNRRNSVADANANSSGSFQLPGSTSYGYDANGNITSRTNARSAANNLSGMGYNHLNLPTNINANGAVNTYTYDANGNKSKKAGYRKRQYK